MSNSKIKSSIITIVVIALAAGGYLIYHYGYLVYQQYNYYTYYENIHGLQRSCPVFIEGVRVGEVSGILMKRKDKVKVTMSIDKEVQIPQGSVALLASTGLLGEKMIVLERSENTTIYNHQDIIKGRYDTSILEMSDQVDPIIESAKYILNTADKNFSNFNRKLDNGLVKKTQKDVKRFEQQMGSYREQVASIRKSANKVTNSVKQLEQQTTEIVRNKDSLNLSLKNAETTTADLAEINYASQTKELHTTVNNADEKAKEVTESASIDKLLNETETYQNATKQLNDINGELKDTKENPEAIQLIGG